MSRASKSAFRPWVLSWLLSCKLLIALGMGSLCGVSFGQLIWSYSGHSLFANEGFSAGWLFFMYQDVDGDTVLSELLFDQDGNPAAGTGFSDDIFMGTDYQTSINARGGVGATIPAGWENDYGGASVYTVAINSNDWATATEFRVFDAATHTLGLTSSHSYTFNEPANSWTAIIPEPKTFAYAAIIFGAVIG